MKTAIFSTLTALALTCATGAHAGIVANALTTNAFTTNGLSNNALTANALTANGLDWNGLDWNALIPNALTNNALYPNAVDSNVLIVKPVTAYEPLPVVVYAITLPGIMVHSTAQ